MPYTIVDVEIDSLMPSPGQPESRMRMDSALGALQDSIRKDKLQYPPLVTRNPDGIGFTIVDGHRRWKAMQQLGWPTVPVLVAQGDPDHLFAAVSGNTKKLTATQWVEVHLNGGTVPPGPTRGGINKLEECVGRDFLARLVRANMSPQIWSLANRMIKYCDIEEDQKISVLNWMLDNRMTRQVAAWMASGNSSATLRSAFQERRTTI